MSYLGRFRPSNDVSLPSYLSVGDRLTFQKLLFPTFPESLPRLGQDLASASCSITAWRSILQSVSFVSLHFQRKDSKNDWWNTRKLRGKAKEIVGENAVSVGWRLQPEKNTWNLCPLIRTWICLLDSFLPSAIKESWDELCLGSHWENLGFTLWREGFTSGCLLQPQPTQTAHGWELLITATLCWTNVPMENQFPFLGTLSYQSLRIFSLVLSSNWGVLYSQQWLCHGQITAWAVWCHCKKDMWWFQCLQCCRSRVAFHSSHPWVWVHWREASLRFINLNRSPESEVMFSKYLCPSCFGCFLPPHSCWAELCRGKNRFLSLTKSLIISFFLDVVGKL